MSLPLTSTLSSRAGRSCPGLCPGPRRRRSRAGGLDARDVLERACRRVEGPQRRCAAPAQAQPTVAGCLRGGRGRVAAEEVRRPVPRLDVEARSAGSTVGTARIRTRVRLAEVVAELGQRAPHESDDDPGGGNVRRRAGLGEQEALVRVVSTITFGQAGSVYGLLLVPSKVVASVGH